MSFLSNLALIFVILPILTSLSSSSIRQLEDIDGVTACDDCKGAGLKCVGRTIDDNQCAACANGQTFWPCNLVKECWCWDTSGPRDPGDTSDGSIACSKCGSGSDTEKCVGNQNSLTPVSDEECSKCTDGQSFWPCTDQDLCWCWDTTKPKKPPAPISGFPLNEDVDPCGIFTEDLFNLFAPNSSFPYTYDGLCDAIEDYNTYHTEKIFQMGSEDVLRMEIAAFLGNTAHESDDYEAAREYLACGDRQEVDGKVYCKPCNNDQYDWEKNECSVSMVDQNSPYNSYCQTSFEPPEGCICDTITQVEEEGPLAGYVEASKVFYGRGAIQLSWNYNYIRASYALTGEPDTFCNDPEQVATDPMYAWGTAIFFFMESQKEGTTCHKEALNKDFGGVLNVINGGLECPAYTGGWHHDAVKMRINRYCHAASLLGLEKLSSFNGCKGLSDSFEECLGDGGCPYCEQYAGVPTEESSSSLAGADEDSPGDNETSISETNGTNNTDTDEAANAETNETDQYNITDADEATNAETNDTNPYNNTERDEVKISAPTPDPAAESTITDSPTVLVSEAGIPAEEPSTKGPTSSTILQSYTPTMKVSNSSLINEPTASVVSDPPSELVPIPTYTPTTPGPTLGPCGGESCPNDNCRSPWGFCGPGEGYCNEYAVWSPTCPTVVAPPSAAAMIDVPAPTNAPIGTSTLNNVFGTSNKSDVEESLPPPTSEPITLTWTGSKATSGPKPTGGKKPPGGKSPLSHEPTASPTSLSIELSNSESLSSQQPTIKPIDDSNEENISLSYPENTYFCGKNWQDANEICSTRCPSSKSDECPDDMSCFAFTKCNDAPSKVDVNDTDFVQSNGSDNVTIASDSLGASHNETLVSVSLPSATSSLNGTMQEGCNGAPCPVENECRSEYGFCGRTFIYCNNLSSWTLEKCGLLGKDSTGETHLCDVELFECPNGEAVYRNPAAKCEYFECPNVEEESAVFPSIFDSPGLSPTLPPLAKPTLPTITKPTAGQSSLAFAPFGAPSFNNIGANNTGESSSESSNNLAILLGGKNESTVAGDSDEVLADDSDESESSSANEVAKQTDFGMYEAEEWLNAVKNSSLSRQVTSTCKRWASVSLALLLIFY